MRKVKVLAIGFTLFGVASLTLLGWLIGDVDDWWDGGVYDDGRY